MGWYGPSCGGCCFKPCAACVEDGPPTFQLDVSGYTNNSCTNCASLNGTFFVPYLDQFAPAFQCFWSYAIPGAPCSTSIYRIELQSFVGPGGLWMGVRVYRLFNRTGGGFNPWDMWYDLVPRETDCFELDLDLPLVETHGSSPTCSTVPATIHLSVA